MGESQDVLQVLVREHREVERLFAAFDVSTDPVQRRELVDHMVIELVRHSAAEEEHLYPAMRKFLASGDALVDRETSGRAEAEKTMNALDGTDPEDAGFRSLVERLEDQSRAHVREAEDIVFPQLEEAMSADDRKEMGRRMLQAKERTPAHPHPHAPDTSPFNRGSAPGAPFVDRIRDHLAGR